MQTRRSFIKQSLVTSAMLMYGNTIASLAGKLPNVLIIGDSISIGYTPFVKDNLKYSAKIVRPVFENGKPENCQGTTNGVKEIKRWIGDTNWDVIHFNFGLHDIKHVDPVTGKNSSNPDHPHQADLKQYKENLKEIVRILKTTGANLIFATTTPYPDQVGGPLRKPGMYEKYNKAAIRIMKQNGISINRLDLFVKPRMEELQKPNNVHFTDEGSRALARKVADRIAEALSERIPGFTE